MAQHSDIARSAIMSSVATPDNSPGLNAHPASSTKDASLVPPAQYPAGHPANVMPADAHRRNSKDGVGIALSDTPMSTAPSSPQM